VRRVEAAVQRARGSHRRVRYASAEAS
jgi:hypothetical protein